MAWLQTLQSAQPHSQQIAKSLFGILDNQIDHALS